MPDEKLNINERRKVIGLSRSTYLKAKRVEKTAILDHLVIVTGLRRMTIMDLLNHGTERTKRKRQRGATYGPDVDDALRIISTAHNHICAERLQPNLVAMAERLAAHGELILTPSLKTQLGVISVSTVQRRLSKIYQDKPCKQRRRKVSTGYARSQIPMTRIDWGEKEPGHYEVDLVHHGGSEPKGHFVYSLVMVDVATGWTVPAAMLGRSRRVMVDAFTRCELRIPFPIIEIHTDNGSEFFTDSVLNHWGEVGVKMLTRSHPYRKNDNRFVEHRNGELIRGWLGHWRIDTAAKTRVLNRFYALLWLYHNFCQPMQRQIEKETLANGKVRRRHDTAQTPFDRLKKTGVLASRTLDRLERINRRINPLSIVAQLGAQLDRLAALPPASEENTEDIYETLLPSSLRKEEGIH